MKPTKTLIRALRETATRIRADQSAYCWVDMDRCNCGLLAQSILGVSEKELERMRREGPSMSSPWSSMQNRIVCGETGLPMNVVLRTLVENGIELEDLSEIEHIGIDRYKVAGWMDNKANELERQRSHEKGQG